MRSSEGTVADLTGEVAVVTGIGGRLGPIWAGALLRAGARVVGLDVRKPPADWLAEQEGDRLTVFEADVTDRAELEAALAGCVAAAGVPTVLVNNAGIDRPPSAGGGSWTFGDVPDTLSGEVFDVNAHGVLRTCQVFGTAMAAAGRGSIVNIGSLYGSMAPDPRLYEHIPLDPPFLKPPAYGMSKAATAALTRYLAALWGPSGVRVNTLSPGGVLGDQDGTFRAKFGARVPLRRMAVAADLTGPLLFLASGQSSYVTGVELLVDGGYVCW